MLFVLKEGEDCAQGLKLLLEERGHRLLAEPGIGSLEKQNGGLFKKGKTAQRFIAILPERSGEEKLSVSYEKDGLHVRYSQKAHFFRGVMKFLRDFEKCGGVGMDSAYGFEEQVWFRENGAMFDCSRNGVLTVEKVKEEIRRMASLGMNTLFLYTEETYELKGYPYFGAFRGRYTAEELRECDAYAALFGVEMIPCIQTLAHLHTALRWNVHAHLKDTADILLAGSEEVYRLIEEMIHTMAGCFRSRKIHLGMDEAHELGLGRFLEKYGYQDRFAIMNLHLKRVCTICQKEGLHPRIWSDMYFRLRSSSGEYYDLPQNADFSDGPKPPLDVCMVYWDYYHTKQEHYDRYFRLHKQLSEQTAFAGGAWTWNGIAPNYSKMFDTSGSALRSCRENGIRDVICTFWQDNGAETPLEAGSPALVYFAESGFGGEAEQEEVDAWLKFLWQDGWDGWKLLDGFDRVVSAQKEDNPSKYLLYQDPLSGLFDGQIRGLRLGEHYRQLEGQLRHYLEEHKKASFLFCYYHTLARLLAVKAELGLQIYDAYQQGARETLAQIGKETLPACIRLSKELLKRRRKLWFGECKPFGFETLDIRLAGVTARLESAVGRLEDYLAGMVDSLPELEEVRLVYAPDFADPEHKLCSCNLWQNIVSAGNMAGI